MKTLDNIKNKYSPIQMTIQFNNWMRRWESFKWWMGALELKSHFNLNKNMIVTFRWRLHLASNPLSWEQFPFVEISAGEGRELSHILRGIIEAPGERRRAEEIRRRGRDGWWSGGAICEQGDAWSVSRYITNTPCPLLARQSADQW